MNKKELLFKIEALPMDANIVFAVFEEQKGKGYVCRELQPGIQRDTDPPDVLLLLDDWPMREAETPEGLSHFPPEMIAEMLGKKKPYH